MTLDAEDIQAVAAATADIIIRKLLGQHDGDDSPDNFRSVGDKAELLPFNPKEFRKAMTALKNGDKYAITRFSAKYHPPGYPKDENN